MSSYVFLVMDARLLLGVSATNWSPHRKNYIIPSSFFNLKYSKTCESCLHKYLGSFGVKHVLLCSSTEQGKGKQSTILWNPPALFPGISTLCGVSGADILFHWFLSFPVKSDSSDSGLILKHPFLKTNIIICIYKSSTFPIVQLWWISLRKYVFILLCLKLRKFKYFKKK